MREGKSHAIMLTSSFPAFHGDYRGSFVLDYARWLELRGHAVDVVTPAGPRPTALPHWGRATGPERPLAVGPPMLFSSLFLGAGVLDELRRRPWMAPEVPLGLAIMAHRALELSVTADLIVSHWLFPVALVGDLIATLRGIPHLIVEHGGGVRMVQSIPQGDRLVAGTLRRAARVQWVARHQKRWAASHGLRCHDFVMPMPPWPPDHHPDPASLGPPSAQPRGLLWLGRMTQAKAPHHLIEALDIIARSDNAALLSGLKVTMAGHGPLRPALEAQARTIPGLAVNFPGEIPQDEVQKLMLQHHTFAFTAAPPSHNQQEGTPRTLLQAMSLGRLVLAAATGGVPDQLQHNQSGLLYDPNHPEQLAHLLLQALAKDDLHTHMVKGALKAASAASWTALANELDHLKDQRFG